MSSPDPAAPNTGTALRASKYSDEQRYGVIQARERGDSGRRVAQLARDGHLRDADGKRIPGFVIPEATVRDLHRRARKRRAREGMAAVEVQELPHREAIEVLRLELVTITAREVRRLKRQQRSTGAVDGAQLQRTMRALIDLARVPARSEPPPPNVNLRDPITGLKGVESRSGEAGSLLKAHRAGSPGLLPAQAPSPANGTPAADFNPAEPVEVEQPLPDPAREIADALRADIEAAAARKGDA